MKKKVFKYIDIENTPGPVTFQLEMIGKAGFKEANNLHKKSCFKALGVVKAR